MGIPSVPGDAEAVLQAGLDASGLELDAAAREALARYLALLSRWNRTYNLVRTRSPEDAVRRHLLDCLAILPHVRGERLLDVGTGAGLPGLVLALARPDLRCVLLDGNRKKVRFCLQAVAELGVRNVEVVHARLEAYKPGRPFETVVARAFASLPELLAGASRLCAPGGRLLAMKGRYPASELAALGASATRGGRIEVVALRVPGLGARRHLVVVDWGSGGGR